MNEVHGLHALATAHKPRAIVHCGALSGPMVVRAPPNAMVAVNILGTANLLEIARIHGIPRFVNCSSTSVYGYIDAAGSVPEDMPLRP